MSAFEQVFKLGTVVPTRYHHRFLQTEVALGILTTRTHTDQLYYHPLVAELFLVTILRPTHIRAAGPSIRGDAVLQPDSFGGVLCVHGQEEVCVMASKEQL